MATVLAYLGENWYALKDGDVAARVAVWHDALETFDFPTMMLAARQLNATYGKDRVPTINDLAESYAAIRRRQEIEPHRIESGERIVPPVEGFRIAWEAYQKECYRLGKRPNRAKFEKWIGTVVP